MIAPKGIIKPIPDLMLDAIENAFTLVHVGCPTLNNRLKLIVF